MIEVWTNAKDVAQKFEKASKNIPKDTGRAIKKSTLWGEKIARSMVAQRSGRLVQGINRTQLQKKGNVLSASIVSQAISNDKHAFPYNFWINENIRAVHLGGGAKAYSYRQTIRRGIPGYFRLTRRMLEKKFPQLAFEEVVHGLKKSMR